VPLEDPLEVPLAAPLEPALAAPLEAPLDAPLEPALAAPLEAPLDVPLAAPLFADPLAPASAARENASPPHPASGRAPKAATIRKVRSKVIWHTPISFMDRMGGTRQEGPSARIYSRRDEFVARTGDHRWIVALHCPEPLLHENTPLAEEQSALIVPM
jgi:hypothetical protein